jgi:ABC-type Fe3+/spermidine/putrescine transport system ATPase subunit
LLDEPLGALDLKLRKAMQLELKALNRALGITFIYVTHDQEEALTMSDRIAVMDRARIAQIGRPAEIYESPRTAFVASFIGESNFFEGELQPNGDVVTGPAGRFRIAAPARYLADGPIRIAVRPEWMDLHPAGAAPPGRNGVDGEVEDVIYLGETIHVLVRLDGADTIKVALRNEGQRDNPIEWQRGRRVTVAWRAEDCQILEADR